MPDNVPLGVVTAIVPLAAPLGTEAWINVSDTTVKVVLIPLKVTLVAPVRLFPRMLTAWPAVPNAGFASTKGASPAEKLKITPQPLCRKHWPAGPPVEVVPFMLNY